MHLSWLNLPFRYRTQADYRDKLIAYIAAVFYERLPAAGFEVREEQIYTAFRIADALTGRRVLLVEAGSGTGKTFAYLIPAVCYARLTGAPAIIAVATAALQDQLGGPGGDIATLSRLLDLAIDARPARDPRHHLCEIKVDLAPDGPRRRGRARLLRWAAASPRGDRAEVGDIPDATWDLVAWDETLSCDTCRRRGSCRQALAREHYRRAADLIICDHDFFFRDLWSRRELREAGRRPLLPDYSAVILDEGHLAPEAARRTAGHCLRPDLLEATLRAAGAASERPALGRRVRAARQALAGFRAALAAAVIPGEGPRRPVRREMVAAPAPALARAIEAVQDELSVEEMFALDEPRLLALQGRLDQAVAGLRLLQEPPAVAVAWAEPAVGEGEPAVARAEPAVAWAEPAAEGEPDLWVAPRRVDWLLQAELYSRQVPVVFCSATLAGAGSFDPLRRTIGAPAAAEAKAGVPFRLARQVLVYVPADDLDPVQRLIALLDATGGRTLVLVPTRREVGALRAALAGRDLPWRLLWEGDADDATLLRRFERDVDSVLVGASYWEGVDVPGAALSCVAVMRLPFPADDPLIAARRADAAALGLDPFAAVDVPEMAARLQQGRGRLIRTAADRGVFALLDTGWNGAPYAAAVRSAFPAGAPVIGSLNRAAPGGLASAGRPRGAATRASCSQTWQPPQSARSWTGGTRA